MATGSAGGGGGRAHRHRYRYGAGRADGWKEARPALRESRSRDGPTASLREGVEDVECRAL